MIDKKHLIVQAGDGGNGRVYFRREKYVPKGGPSGGQGGDGGSIVIQASRHLSSLKHLAHRHRFKADSGKEGMRQKKSGAKGRNLIIKVPLGTQVKVLAQNQVSKRRLNFRFDSSAIRLSPPIKRKQVHFQTYSLEREGQAVPARFVDDQMEKLENKPLIAHLIEDKEELTIVQGGFGGKGNASFKSSTQTTPLVAEYGTFGEKRELELELTLLADVGFVGLPSVGKSTLLSILTSAKPKIASYPFTTLEPNLGLMNYKNQELVLADLPGLIEGAHQGKGLGDRFLKHITHTRAIIFVLALPDNLALDQSVSTQKKIEYLTRQFKQLEFELKEYDPSLLKKPYLILVNKIDLEPNATWHHLLSQKLDQVIFISAKTGSGLDELRDKLIDFRSV